MIQNFERANSYYYGTPEHGQVGYIHENAYTLPCPDPHDHLIVCEFEGVIHRDIICAACAMPCAQIAL